MADLSIWCLSFAFEKVFGVLGNAGGQLAQTLAAATADSSAAPAGIDCGSVTTARG